MIKWQGKGESNACRKFHSMGCRGIKNFYTAVLKTETLKGNGESDADYVDTCTLFFSHKQPEKDLSLEGCFNFSLLLRSKLLKIPLILVKLTRKQ